MSSTRSHSPKAPATERCAILVSHGQPSDPAPAETVLGALARAITAQDPGCALRSATLAQPGALEAALEASGPAPLIYPLFMTDGWFTRSALPKRLAGHDAQILTPLGSGPGLPALMAAHLARVLEDLGWTPTQTHLLVAAHGSARSNKSAEDTEAFMQRLGAALAFGEMRPGYVEQDPRLEDAARACPDQAICLPFFAAFGGHMRDDVMTALERAEFAGPVLDPLGTLPEIPAFIAAALRAAVAVPA